MRGAVALGLLLAMGAPASAQTPRLYVVDPARSQIRFHAVSRLMDADGTFRRFGGEIRLDPARPETATARLAVEMASLDTGIRMRDDHLRSDAFFDVARHPQATFVSSSIVRDGDHYRVAGSLTIRGVARDVATPVTLTAGGDGFRIAGQFVVDRRDFGVRYQSVLNPIRDEVRVSFDLTAAPR